MVDDENTKRLRLKIKAAKKALAFTAMLLLGKGLAASNNTRPDDKPKDNTENVVKDKVNDTPVISSTELQKLGIGDMELSNGMTLLAELPIEGIATYKINGLRFCNEDFEGCPSDPVIIKLNKQVAKIARSKRYPIKNCAKAVREQVMPLLPLKGQAVSLQKNGFSQGGKQFYKVTEEGCIPGFCAFHCKGGQTDNFSNLDGYFNAQVARGDYPGHLGYYNPKTGNEFYGRGPYVGRVTASGMKGNKYDPDQRGLVTTVSYVNYAINKRMREKDEKLYFIKKDNSNIIDIYTPETLPEKIKSQIATVTPQEIQMAMKVGKNVMFAEQDKDSPDTLNVTSIESMKKIESKNPNALLFKKLAKSHNVTPGKGQSSDGSAGNGDSGEDNSDGTAVNVVATTTDNRGGSLSPHYTRDGRG